jgi:hypothetical protein
VRALLLGSLLAATLVLPVGIGRPSGEAQAFGDRCYRDVTVRGVQRGSMSSARESAINAWEAAVRQRHGVRFADWYYSGDRSIDCSWNTNGSRFYCRAVALPCGRVA